MRRGHKTSTSQVSPTLRVSWIGPLRECFFFLVLFFLLVFLPGLEVQGCVIGWNWHSLVFLF